MSLFDRIFAGKVIHDFGVLEEASLGIGKRKLSLLLVEKKGEVRLVLKMAATSILGGNIRCTHLAATALPKLARCVAEAQELAESHSSEVC